MLKSTMSASFALTGLGLAGVLAGNASAASDSAKVAIATDKLVADSLKGLNKSKLTVTFRDASLTLYGNAQFNAAWQNQRGNYAPADYVSYAATSGVVPSAGTSSVAHTGQLALTANASRLGFRFLAGDPSSISYDGKVEGDFYGNLRQTTANGAAGTQNEIAPLFELRHAFATINYNPIGLKILLGQTSEILSPLDPSAASGTDFGTQLVNFNGLSGSGVLGTRYPQIQARETIELLPATKDHLAGQLAIAASVNRTVGAAQVYINGSNQQPDAGEEASIPTFEGRVEFRWPLIVPTKNVIVGVAGHFAQEDLLDYGNSNEHTINSWSLVSNAYIPLHKYVLVNGTFGFGADLYNHCANIGQATTFDTAKGLITHLYRPEGLFGFAALRLNPDHLGIVPLVVNAGFGFDSVYASKLKPHTQARTRNTTAYVNANYYLNNFNWFGVEVSRIETDYLDKGTTLPAVSERLWRYDLVYQYQF